MFDEDFLQSVMRQTLSKGGDYADIFLEETRETSIIFNDRKVASISTGIVQGAGIRIITGKSYVYVYANNVDEDALLELACQAAAAQKQGKAGTFAVLGHCASRRLHEYKVLPGEVDLKEKIAILARVDEEARCYSPLIAQVSAGYFDTVQTVNIATSEGRFVQDERIRTLLTVNAIAARGEEREKGHFDMAKSQGFEMFETITPEAIAREAARTALVLLEADDAPAGTMPVVIAKGSGGIIFHEACGHALEASSVADDASVFSGKLGTPIASDCITAIDDGSLPGEHGSAAYDDEALEPRKNVLIERGVLKNYLVDRLGQAKMGLPANGTGRRESYKFAPTSRMSNTYIAPGSCKEEELFHGIKLGLYCARLGGGSVNPGTSDFNFSVQEAYLIENGKLTKPVKNATLIGKGTEILMKVDMVADTLELSAGSCGARSGIIPVCTGQPAIRVHGLVVGGRQ